MNTGNKESVDSTATNQGQNTYPNSEEHFIAQAKQSEPKQVLKTIDMDGSCPIDPDNIGSIPLLQIYRQQARLRGLVKHSAKIMTPEQIQRLQACVKEIAAILREQTPATRTGH